MCIFIKVIYWKALERLKKQYWIKSWFINLWGQRALLQNVPTDNVSILRKLDVLDLKQLGFKVRKGLFLDRKVTFNDLNVILQERLDRNRYKTKDIFKKNFI